MRSGIGRTKFLNIADESLLSVRRSAEAAGAEFRLAASIKPFEPGGLSSGAAARLAGLPRTLFLTRLADYGVDTFTLSDEGLARQTPLAEVICTSAPVNPAATRAGAQPALRRRTWLHSLTR